MISVTIKTLTIDTLGKFNHDLTDNILLSSDFYVADTISSI